MNASNNPLSFKNLIAGIIVTVVGGVIVAYIIQDARFGRQSLTPHPQLHTPTVIAETVHVSTPTLIPIPTLTLSPSPLPVAKAIIDYPTDNASVGHKEYVSGNLTNLGSKHAFLVIQSTSLSEKIYPQHDGQLNFELFVDHSTGKWSMREIYATSGAKYKTFVVATDDQALINMLSLEQSALYGIDPNELPLESMIISNTVTVLVK